MSEGQCRSDRLLAEGGGITSLRRPVARKPGLLAGNGMVPARVSRSGKAARHAAEFARTASATWRGLLVASLLVPAVVASARPASAQAEIELLSATLTPKQWQRTFTDNSVETRLGCLAGVSQILCTTEMTDHDFTEEAVNYVVRNLYSFTEVTDENVVIDRAVTIVFRPGLSTRLQTMTLHVGDSALAFPAARGSYDGNNTSDRTWAVGWDVFTENTPVSIRLTRPNVAPTAVDGGVGTYLNEAYTFTATDFGFSDVDEEHGQSLQSVRIVALPASGTLMLGGTAVTAGQSVAKGDLDAGRLTYIQPGADPEDVSFTFKVSDGTAESDEPYTMDIEVRSPAPGAAGEPDRRRRRRRGYPWLGGTGEQRAPRRSSATKSAMRRPTRCR